MCWKPKKNKVTYFFLDILFNCVRDTINPILMDWWGEWKNILFVKYTVNPKVFFLLVLEPCKIHLSGKPQDNKWDDPIFFCFCRSRKKLDRPICCLGVYQTNESYRALKPEEKKLWDLQYTLRTRYFFIPPTNPSK